MVYRKSNALQAEAGLSYHPKINVGRGATELREHEQNNARDGDVVHLTTHKTVKTRFMGRELSFRLSHALFSSNSIDEGTEFLLKTIAQRILSASEAGPDASVATVMDIGCGTGVLGISVASRIPNAHLFARDRDALALAFTRRNAMENGILADAVDTGPALLLDREDRRADLVLCNYPAKTGMPVMTAAIPWLAALCTPTGVVALVIVQTLADDVRQLLGENQLEITYEEHRARYSVYHFRRSAHAVADAGTPTDEEARSELPPPYVRNRKPTFSTVWGLPNFDQPEFGLSLALKAVSSVKLREPCLFWEPGQGHAAREFILSHRPEKGPLLAGRDVLALRVTAQNCRAVRREPRDVVCLASIVSLTGHVPEGSLQSLVVHWDPVPQCPMEAEFWSAASTLLQRGGTVVVWSASTHIHRLLERNSGFSLVNSRKARGTRCVVLKKG
ncbi:MAG: methyltransferase domain-containing protein [Spirochaetaceae bacterium]|nr:MAG: methyltransferase domain-containing protein [Spirochaetaceae bacterium]